MPFRPGRVEAAAGLAAVGLLRLYQRTLSPDHGPLARFRAAPVCRFVPTCSENAIRRIRGEGLRRGGAAAYRQFCDCRPDPIPEEGDQPPHVQDRPRRRLRDRAGRHHPVLVLSLSLLRRNRTRVALALAAALLYAANEAVLKPHLGRLAQGHLNDVLAGVLLLAWAGFLASAAPRCEAFVGSLRGSLLISFLAGLYWEWVAPIYLPQSTPDPIDLAAYGLGGMIAWAACRVAGNGRPGAPAGVSAGAGTTDPGQPGLHRSAATGAMTHESPR